jgi:hypothetical protein
MGWDNTTEMVATVVDSITRLTRMTHNMNVAQADQILDPIPLMLRPYETAVDVEPVKAAAVSLADFNALLAEGD